MCVCVVLVYGYVGMWVGGWVGVNNVEGILWPRPL
jgi:hypothetical protein